MIDAKMHIIDLVAPGKRCRVRLRRSDGSKVTSEAFITCVAVVEPRQESIPWRLTTDSLSRPDRKAPGLTDPGEVTVTFKLSGKPIEELAMDDERATLVKLYGCARVIVEKGRELQALLDRMDQEFDYERDVVCSENDCS